jgi:hypothetical protein
MLISGLKGYSSKVHWKNLDPRQRLYEGFGFFPLFFKFLF